MDDICWVIVQGFMILNGEELNYLLYIIKILIILKATELTAMSKYIDREFKLSKNTFKNIMLYKC